MTKIKKCACALVFFLFTYFPSVVFAQGQSNDGGLVASEGNFTSFSAAEKTATREQWILHNENAFLNHPEFGLKAPDAPNANVVEILSKRTANERFFINPENPAEFYQQTSYGPLHYEVNGEWVSINTNLQPAQNGIYEAVNQPEPVGFDISQQHSYIKTVYGRASFNSWKLYGVKNGTELLLADADWSNYTAGDDGIYITCVFPGIDLKMRVFQGAIKSEFIVKELLFENVDYLLFKDTFNSGGSFTQAESAPTEYINSSGTSVLTIGDAVIYPKNAPKEEMIITDYRQEQNVLCIPVSYSWLAGKIASGHIIIDPLVTSTNTLAQASILGSQYNSSCAFDNSCDYYLTVNTPANATVTNILANFTYLAASPCWLNEGATRFNLGSCVSPVQTGYYWFCNLIGSGTCNGNNIPVWSDFSSCVPAPSCTPIPLDFTLRFYRGCYGAVGCASGCISPGSAWSMVIQGYTLQYSSSIPAQQILLSATSVCQGGTVTATSNGIQYGVPPYDINWSLSPTGTPSIGTGTTIPVTLTNIGSNTIYCIVTDACNNVITSNRTVTVTTPPAGPAVTTPVNHCLNATATALTSPGTSPQWYTDAAGSNPVSAPVPSTTTAGTTSYWVSQMVNGCESQLSQVDVVVHAPPVISGTAVITPSECLGSTGGVSGLTTNALPPITYTWLNSAGTVLSTSTTSSQLTGQPAGEYTLVVTDGYGCQGNQSGNIIPNQNGPNPPVVTSPVVYCQNDTPSPLSATGTALLWYTTSAGGTGSTSAPTPSTSTPGNTSYFVSQTQSGCESLLAEIVVEITPTPAPPVVTSPISYCQNETPLALSAIGTNLLWYSSPAGGTGTTSPPAVNTSTGGDFYYYVSQTVNLCESPRTNILVEIIPLATITGNPIVAPANCNEATGSISGLLVTANSLTLNSFTWINEAGDVVGNSTSLSNQPAGSYTLIVTDQHPCSASYGPVTIPLISPPAPPQSQSPVEYCLDYPSQPLNATGSSILWYTTSTGGTGSPTAPVPVTTVIGTTSYFVTQTVDGCESERREVVINVADAPGAEFTVSAQSGCSPYCITFQNLSTPSSSPIATYQWSADGEFFSNEQNPRHCFTTGDYDIKLIVTDALGCTRTLIKEDFITAVPTPVAAFTTNRNEAPEEDARIVFTSIDPRANETVVWNFGDGATDTAYVAEHYFPKADRYCVIQTVTNVYGCSDSSEQCVLITSDLYLYVPNAFTPTGEGINDVWKPVVKGEFTSYKLSIFNRWGERVFFSNDTNTPWIGDVEGGKHLYAPDGMYHFIIVLEDKEKMPREYRGHIQLLR